MQSILGYLSLLLIFHPVFTFENELENCTKILCAKKFIITSRQAKKLTEDLNRLQNKWNNNMDKNICNATLNNRSLGLSIVLTSLENFRNLQEKLYNRNIWWTGICGHNITVVLSTENSLDCNRDKLHNVSTLNVVKSVSKLDPPLRYEISAFILGMVHLFFHKIAYNQSVSDSTLEDFNAKFHGKCQIMTYNSPPERSSLVDTTLQIIEASTAPLSSDWTEKMMPMDSNSSSFSSVSGNYSSTTIGSFGTSPDYHNVTEYPSLTRHHGGGSGNLFYLIITLVCTLFGGSCLTFLLCFNRTRHFICTCCSLCREANRYKRLFDDP